MACLALSTSALLAGCGSTYRATIGTNTPTPVPTEPFYLPVVVSTAGSVSQGTATLFESPGESTILDLSGDSVVDLVNVGIAPVALVEGSGGSIAYVVDLGSTASPYTPQVSSFGISSTTQTPQVNTTSLNVGTGAIYSPLAPAQPTPCTTPFATPPPAVFADASLIYVSQTTANQVLPLSRNISGTGVPALESVAHRAARQFGMVFEEHVLAAESLEALRAHAAPQVREFPAQDTPLRTPVEVERLRGVGAGPIQA